MGLCDKPLHLMNDEEKRLHVVYVQQMRQSFQTFKSEIERKANEKGLKQPKKVDLSELDEIL